MVILIALLAIAWLILAAALYRQREAERRQRARDYTRMIYEEVELTDEDVEFLKNLKPMLRRPHYTRFWGNAMQSYIDARGWRWPLNDEQAAAVIHAFPLTKPPLGKPPAWLFDRPRNDASHAVKHGSNSSQPPHVVDRLVAPGVLAVDVGDAAGVAPLATKGRALTALPCEQVGGTDRGVVAAVRADDFGRNAKRCGDGPHGGGNVFGIVRVHVWIIAALLSFASAAHAQDTATLWTIAIEVPPPTKAVLTPGRIELRFTALGESISGEQLAEALIKEAVKPATFKGTALYRSVALQAAERIRKVALFEPEAVFDGNDWKADGAGWESTIKPTPLQAVKVRVTGLSSWFVEPEKPVEPPVEPMPASLDDLGLDSKKK